MNDMSIMVVEDETAIATLLQYNLEKAGFSVTCEEDGAKALELLQKSPPSLVLLDWMLPSLSGIEICKALRQNAGTRDLPIIMLTARTEDADTVAGLDSGADDYVTKPFSVDALLARIRALLRRQPVAATKEAEVIAFDNLTLDPVTHKVKRGERRLRLGPTEFRLLDFFIRNPGKVFSREELLSAVWGDGIHVEPRTIDVHIRRLRLAINHEGEPDLLRTVRSAGYALDIDKQEGRD